MNSECSFHQYLIGKEFQEIPSRLIPYAQAKGIYTDEDVERLLKESSFGD